MNNTLTPVQPDRYEKNSFIFVLYVINAILLIPFAIVAAIMALVMGAIMGPKYVGDLWLLIFILIFQWMWTLLILTVKSYLLTGNQWMVPCVLVASFY